MARRRGRPKKGGVSRYPGGQIASDLGSAYAAAQKIGPIDPAARAAALFVLGKPEWTWSAKERDIVDEPIKRAAKDQQLEYQIGIAYRVGVFREVTCSKCGSEESSWQQPQCRRCAHAFGEAEKAGERAGAELLLAADKYVSLHQRIWQDLPRAIEDDIKGRWGTRGFKLLAEAGKVTRGPAPPASLFRKLVPSDRGLGIDHLDSTERERQRWREADRYGAARGAMMRAGLHCLLIVENMAIAGIRPRFLELGAARTGRGLDDARALIGGLKALAAFFEKGDRR